MPKETVIYRDSKTGRELTAKEIESLDVNIKQPEFYFTVNGKPAKFEKTVDERWVFDKNKGLLTQTSTASIDIKVPVIEKNSGVGLYGSTGSAGVFVTHKALLLFGGAKYNGGFEAGIGAQFRF